MRNSKSILLCIIFVMTLVISLAGQSKIIDINANMRRLEAYKSDDPEIINMFSMVSRYRLFEYNEDLLYLSSENRGDYLSLTFFDDTHYTAEILEVTLNEDNSTVVTAKILESDFGYIIIVVEENSITLSARIPLEDEFFFASTKNGQSFLGQVQLSQMAEDELGCDVIEQSNELVFHEEDEPSNTRNETIIDLLFVYTNAAAQWALNDWRVSNINHLIDVVLATSNLVMSNSDTGITFRIAHKHLTDYVETDTSMDLSRITQPNDGYMDEVHVLRDTHHADLIVFLAHISYTGGAAWLLQSFNGHNPDYWATSINRVQQASWTFTVVHEMGHNMGTAHHRDQNYQPGPNYSLGNYASGWRGSINYEMITTVMSYERGQYYSDGIDGVRIPYFSSPLINIGWVTIGHVNLYDNARILRETKAVTAAYRTPTNLQYDISPQIITGPPSNMIGSPKTYTIKVINYGQMNANNFTLNLKQIGNNTPLATQIITNDIEPSSSTNYSLEWTPASIGIAQLYAEIIWEDDQNPDNDLSPILNVKIHPEGTFLFEDWDSALYFHDLGWKGNYFSRTGAFAGSGVNQSKGFALNMNSENPPVNIMTPNFVLPYTNVNLSFSYRIVNYTENWNAPLSATVLNQGDKVVVEVYIDMFDDFFSIYEINNANHTPSTSFATITESLDGLVNYNIYIRIAASGSTGDWFFVLDNVYISSNDPNFYDLAAISLTGPNEVIHEEEVAYLFTIQNQGYIEATGYSVLLWLQDELNELVSIIDTPNIETGGSDTILIDWTPSAHLPTGTHNIYAEIIWEHDLFPENNISEEIIININPVSEIDLPIELYKTELIGNYPNPFNPSTTIYLSLQHKSYLRVDIYNIKGQKVKSLVDDHKPAGNHSISWNGTDDNEISMGSGIYFYKMETEGYVETKKMVLMK